MRNGKSRGLEGPGGPVRTSDYRRTDSLEVWGVQCNPGRLGMVGEQRTIVAIKPLIERLSRHPSIRKQFSQLAQCVACVEREKPDPRYVNGRGLCLAHEYLRGEGLLGYVVRGNTYATCRIEKSL